MLKEVTVGVVTAITIAIIFYLWNQLQSVSINVPTNAVIAFNDDKCPDIGWEEYKPAYGHFIRGIDKSKSGGQRLQGSQQQDSYPKHTHRAYMQVGAEPARASAGAKSHRAAGGHGMAASGSERYETNEFLQSAGEGSETRPKNVALLYCIKK